MLRRLLIHHYRRPAGALRKISSLVSNPPPSKRFQLYLAAAAPLAVTGYAAFARTGYGNLEVSDTDLVSDEALWALYERWCRHHKIHRTAEDMRQRFDIFKWHARHVYDINHLDLGYNIALNHFSDDIEEARNGCGLSFRHWAKDIKKLEEKASLTKEAPRGDACAICRQEFSASHPSVVIGCKHEFHPSCIFKWRFISSNCRVCWQPITLKDPTSEEFEEKEGKVLWSLYETWSHNQGFYKSPEDMKRGFNKLKSSVQSLACHRDIGLSNRKHDKRELPIEEEEEEEEDDQLSRPPAEAHH